MKPKMRMLSPTQRRIAFVDPGSNTERQLRQLGWRPYWGSAEVTDGSDGICSKDVKHGLPDPRNGWIVPGSDPKLQPVDRPAGSLDFNPSALKLT